MSVFVNFKFALLILYTLSIKIHSIFIFLNFLALRHYESLHCPIDDKNKNRKVKYRGIVEYIQVQQW